MSESPKTKKPSLSFLSKKKLVPTDPEATEAPPTTEVAGEKEKQMSVLIPVTVCAGYFLINKSWELSPVFEPMTGWKVIMGLISFMYIVAFWVPAEAMNVFFTVPYGPVSKVFPDNKVWGFFGLACINWLATVSLLFLACVLSDPCPTRLLEIAMFCFVYNIRGHLVMLMGWGCPEGAVSFKDAAGDIVPIWTATALSLWQYSMIPRE